MTRSIACLAWMIVGFLACPVLAEIAVYAPPGQSGLPNVPSITGIVGQTVMVPIYLSISGTSAPTGSCDVKLTYDRNALQITGTADITIGTVNSGWSPVANTTSAGVAYVVSYGGNAVSSGNVLNVLFHVLPSALSGATTIGLYNFDYPARRGYAMYSGSINLVVPSASWKNDGGGVWSAAANWVGPVPDAYDAQAVLGNVITTARTVTLNVPVITGQLTISTTGGGSYILSGSNPLTMRSNTGTATVNVASGSHLISAGVVLGSTTNFDLANASDVLRISGAISGSGGLSKSGLGALVLAGTGNNYGGDTLLSAGTLQAVSLSGSGSTTVAGGAVLQVNYLEQNALTVGAGGVVVLGGVSAASGMAAADSSLSAGSALFAGRSYSAGSLPGGYGGVSVGGDSSPTVVPEPGTWVLLTLGALGLPLLAWRRRKRR